MIPYVLTEKSVTVQVGAKTFTYTKDSREYAKLKKMLHRRAWGQIKKMVTFDSALNKTTSGKISIKDGMVFFNNSQVHNLVVDRIMEFRDNGSDYSPMVKFLERLMKNPNERSREELFGFLEAKNIPLTKDGCFLGYKAITSDWLDKHSQTVKHALGKEIRMLRDEGDENYRLDCSNGFHVGNLDYVTNFRSGNDIMLVVRVDPRDVISVPASETSKLRTCAYTPVSIYKEALKFPCYNVPEVDENAQNEERQPKVYKSKFANDSWKKIKRTKDGKFKKINPVKKAIKKFLK